ncbi:macro domain-containing protein [Dendronalium sp. ChiSLP03b]|uniref:type II toxin-antitoxin system antitoxin DNA ADP-ribosyl glycohydrolase DarG n=1 Tax=Dendronalium sp. ChiSLP03b TaxID=3075381 RepID=UPI002AD328F4|nr:macro domain-containing protein [Dendronalium sp. ChiSLP03b]MDZ8204044.1 macro domain-containing protein [Dendronalium sp. ChiSLP03b]
MFKFTVGDILESTTECLVNTVNCEGYMGKGIAYQFKLRFPDNNKEYIKACRNKSLRIGTLHYCWEEEKLIINFPTKDRWREKSKIEYIHLGLSELVNLIPSLNIKSIAIPPLGCGNGGLSWTDVRPIILEYLTPISYSLDILIYEPSKYYAAKITKAPKLNASHLVLMNFKSKLHKFNKFRLQKTGFFMNLFSTREYFKFSPNNYGPYAHAIDILSRDIRQFQEFYNITTDEALSLAKTMLISESVEQTLKNLSNAIDKATVFVNEIVDDEDLELLSTICYLLEKEDLKLENINSKIKDWSLRKADKFTENSILEALGFLKEKHIIEINLLGLYSLIK